MTFARLLPILAVPLGLLAGAHLAFGSGAAKGYTAVSGLTFEGTPGASPKASADTLTKCREACNANGSCLGFSFDSDSKACTISLGYDRFEPAPTSAKLYIAGEVSTAALAKLADFAATSYDQYDGPGHDIRSYDHVVSESMCQALCGALDACVAYTWRDSDDRCWLKDDVPALRQRAGLVSGYKRWEEPGVPKYVDFAKVSLDGDTLREETIPLDKDLKEECARRCRADDACEAATVRQQGRRCLMYSELDVATVRTDNITSSPTLLIPLDFKQTRRYRALQEGEASCSDQPGNDLRSTKAESLRLCRATCAATDGCKAFTWNTSTKTCYLKSASSVPRPNANSCISTTAWTAGLPF